MNANKVTIGFRITQPSLYDSGFTLIELMFSTAILAILLSLAAPSFRQFITSNRLTAQANSLVADLSRTRNEAGTRSHAVNMCIATSSTACASTGNDWSAGWIIWVDTNGNASLDSGEIIKYAPALDGGVSLIASGPSNPTALTYQPYGGLGSSSSTWTYTLCAPNDTSGRQIVVPSTGRPSVKRVESCI